MKPPFSASPSIASGSSGLVHDRPNEDLAVPRPGPSHDSPTSGSALSSDDDAGSSYNSVIYAQSAIAQNTKNFWWFSLYFVIWNLSVPIRAFH